MEGGQVMFAYTHGTKRDIKWYLRRLSKDPTIEILSISDYIPEKTLSVEELLTADRDNKYYKVRVNFRRK